MIGKGCSYSLNQRDLENINMLLCSHNLRPIHNIEAREYFRANVNRKTYCSKNYQRLKKRDNSIIKFMENPPSVKCMYGIVETLIVAGGYQLAFVTTLTVVCKGPPGDFVEITQEAAEVIFEDYLTFEKNEIGGSVIFIHQILDLCCNLSNNDWNVLSYFANNIERE